MGRIEGKVAIVTGAAKGIGEGCAVVLAREGATVVVADVDEKAGCSTAEKIQNGGGQAVFIRCDVMRYADIQTLVAATVQKFASSISL